MSFSMLVLLVIPSPVLAEGEEPPTEETPVVEATAEPVPEVVEPTIEVPAEPVVEVVEVVETLAEENLVLVDETGTEVPLASEEAAQAITSGDPWFVANDGSGNVIGYTSLLGTCAPTVTICYQVANPVQAAIDDPLSDNQDITIDGVYKEQVHIINKDVNLVGATSGGGLTAPGELTKNGTMSDGTDLFGLVYIYGGKVNLLGLTIVGSAGYVSDSGNDIYAGVVFDNATGGVVASNIFNFSDSDANDQGVGICVYESAVNIEQNEISNAETGVLVKNSAGTEIEHNKIHDISNNDLDTQTVGVDLQDSYYSLVWNNEIYNINAMNLLNEGVWSSDKQ